MVRWPGVRSCRLVVEGKPRNGVGAVREVSAGGLVLLEEVVEFEPPHRLVYTIIKGLPVRHRGTIELREQDGATVVEWRVRMTSAWPGLAFGVRTALGFGLDRALEFVRKELEARP
jgi:uncharacterized protein YndB with AHSA1/START domain